MNKSGTGLDIFTSFAELLNGKSNNEVSIQNIANYAGIHRATFYRYFENKEDLIYRGTMIFTDSIIDTVDKSSEGPGPDDKIKAYFLEIEKYKKIFKVLMNFPESRMIIEQRIRKYISEFRIFPRLDEKADQITADSVIKMISASLTAMTEYFLEKDLSVDRAVSVYKKFIFNAAGPFLD